MTVLPAYNPLNAAATVIAPKKNLNPTYDAWQDQLWDYYDRLGELESGVTWRSNAMSRVRLLAAEVQPSGGEPVPIEEGPAAEAVQRLAGGIGGQSQLLKAATIQLSVPGEGWLVGEVDRSTGEPQLSDRGELRPDDEMWSVKSADELRVSTRTGPNGNKVFEIRQGDNKTDWRSIDENSLVVRFWDPHPRYGWKADSAARHAMSDLAELDAVNKRIMAQIMSRLASNGILLYDKERLSVPAPDQNDSNDKVDPFARMLVDVASRAIKDPTSPEALIPIPIGHQLQDLRDVDVRSLLQHITLSDLVDDKLLNLRESAIKKLASSLDMPAEILLGMSGMNHWGAWQIEESGIKIHIAPVAELICYSLTTGFLVPTLKAGQHELRGPNGGRIIVWYDPSEITQRPDNSRNAIALADRLWLSSKAAVREAGFDVQDMPSQEELDEMVGLLQARGITLGGAPTLADDENEARGGADDAPGGLDIPDTMDDERPDDDLGLPGEGALPEAAALMNGVAR